MINLKFTTRLKMLDEREEKVLERYVMWKNVELDEHIAEGNLYSICEICNKCDR